MRPMSTCSSPTARCAASTAVWCPSSFRTPWSCPPGQDRASGPKIARMSAPHTSAPAPLPYLTKDFPGIGGAIKQRPEDFFVQELPLYEPSGQGEHVYVEVQKIGLTTF